MIVGQWNPHIFSPKWMCEKLLEVKDVEAEFTIGPLGAGMRYMTAQLAIIPGPDRLIVGMRNALDDTLKEAERITIKALSLLAHTPVRAGGINFAFTESNASEVVLKAFQLSDNYVLANAGYSPSCTEIVRDIRLDHSLLKLKMVHSDKEPTKFHFNFHHDLESPTQATDLLRDKTVICRDFALSLLKNSYGLSLEEEDNGFENLPQ